ncbi:MAG: carboxypeptidase-like regulatory domain-containing protein [Bacteroides sp.]|nr:carboxypeptidase-like regulatory domain-containing protein [Bacteroides sp.]
MNYIKGFRKGKEAHRLEKEAMKDPFLSEALEGYDQVPGEHEKAILDMQNRITGKSARRKSDGWIWSAVAVVTGLLFVGGYYLWNKEEFEKFTRIPEVAMNDVLQEEQVPETVLPPDLVTRHQKKETEITLLSSSLPARTIPVEPVADELVMVEDSQEGVEMRYVPISTDEDVLEERMMAAQELQQRLVTASRVHKRASEVTLDGNYIKGLVTDQSGEPVIGASVTLKGKNEGVVTNLNGEFELPARSEDQLAVHYVGYEPVTIPVDTGRFLRIALKEDEQALSEAVVVGYGTVKKENKRGLPKPVGGKKRFNDYLKKNRQALQDEECRDVKGEVTVAFSVNEADRPQQIRMVKGLCHSADREAIRLIEEGPDWTPGEKEVEITIGFE